MTYQEADQLLQGRCRNRRKIANNTYLHRGVDANVTCFYIKLHGNNIIEFLEDGTILYNTCGRETRLTKDRMNRFGEARIYQKQYRWYDRGIEVGQTWKNTDSVMSRMSRSAANELVLIPGE